MKKIFFRLAAVAAAAFSLISCSEAGGTLKVMSYNIRFDSPGDGENIWDNRKPATIAMLDEVKPDVFGVQEAMAHQIDYIAKNAPLYDKVGVGREDGVAAGEHMSIFWNKETVEMQEWGTYWLSETPEVPSFGWDAACKRTATWALMKDKRNGKKFFFVNTHLDHVGVEARRNGLALVVERIAVMNPKSYPMVLTGDFNMIYSHPSLADLNGMMTCTREVAPISDRHNTYNGWGKVPEYAEEEDCIIDFIYESGFKAVNEYQTVTKRYADKPYISDHYPIMSVLEY